MKIKTPKKRGFIQKELTVSSAREVLTGLCAILHTERTQGIHTGDALLQRFGDLNKVWLLYCIEHRLTPDSTKALQSFYNKLIAGEFHNNDVIINN